MRYLVLVALLACSGDDVMTNGEACTAFGSAMCERADDCGFLTNSVSQCTALAVAGCCAGDCDEPARGVSDGEVDDCRSALETWECEALGDAINGETQLPLECVVLD